MINIISYKKIKPKIGKKVFIAPGSSVIGNVQIGANCSIWFNVVIRGDVEKIRIGKKTNIQDLTMIHCTTKGHGAHIGSNVTIGHNCVIHDCKIENNSLIGMSSTILDGAIIEKNSMVAAGSLVTQNKVVKTGEIWSGKPAKFMRKMTKQELNFLKKSAERYYLLGQEYLANLRENT